MTCRGSHRDVTFTYTATDNDTGERAEDHHHYRRRAATTRQWAKTRLETPKKTRRY
ncbi:hypothetical protein O9992_19720 [Vibrio lentus]|nr:hypothetical protein [Vibrio lentus]